MKTIKLLSAAVTLITITIFAGCKKDKAETKKPDCKIITVTPTTGNSINLSYNLDGKLATLSSGNDVTTFVYSGNTAIGTTNTSGVFSSKKIITLNSNGLATNVRTENNTSGTDWNNSLYEYSGTQIIKATSTSSSGGTPSVSMVTWSNDNLATITSGSNVTTLDYYTDKSAQKGDYLYLAQLVQGYDIYRTKNLLKSILSGSTITTFTYSFDTDGKISAIALSDGTTNLSYTYQFQCN